MPRLSLALLPLWALALLAPHAAFSEPVFVDGIVAIVGNDIVTWSELEEAEVSLQSDPTFTPEDDKSLKKQVLDRMIEDLLINQAAARDSIDVTEQEVDRAIEGWLRQNQITRDVLDKELSREGISYDEYHSNMRKHLIQSRFIESTISPRVTVTDAQIRAYYAREVSNVKREDVAEVYVIFLPFPEDATEEAQLEVLSQARALRERIQTREVTFEQAAKELSAHPSAAEGGLLGEFHKGELFPTLDEVAFSKDHEKGVSEPLVTAQGIFLARSTVKQVADTIPLEEARPQIEALLYQQELERQLRLWIEDARRQAHIEILAKDAQL